jgi:hypothetical protein
MTLLRVNLASLALFVTLKLNVAAPEMNQLMANKIKLTGSYVDFQGIIVEMDVEGRWESVAGEEEPLRFRSYFGLTATLCQEQKVVIVKGEMDGVFCDFFRECMLRRQYRKWLRQQRTAS